MLKDPWSVGPDPVEALRSGDRGPFEDFVRARSGALLSFFKRRGASASEAEDLTQDVFLKLYQSANRYQQQGTFGAYVMRVAGNAWIDRRRRAALRPVPTRFGPTRFGPRDSAPGTGAAAAAKGSLPEPIGREASPSAQLELADENQRLQRALAGLPQTHARVFELAVVQGLPYAEISAMLDIPVGTVKSRVHHAVARLRQLLEPTQPKEGVS